MTINPFMSEREAKARSIREFLDDMQYQGWRHGGNNRQTRDRKEVLQYAD